MKTLNKNVAVAPFKRESLEEGPRPKGLDLRDTTTTKLIATEVLFDSDSFNAGDTLYFRNDILRMPQVKQTLEFNGKPFILMVEEWVVFVERAKKDRPAALPASSNGQ